MVLIKNPNQKWDSKPKSNHILHTVICHWIYLYKYDVININAAFLNVNKRYWNPTLKKRNSIKLYYIEGCRRSLHWIFSEFFNWKIEIKHKEFHNLDMTACVLGARLSPSTSAEGWTGGTQHGAARPSRISRAATGRLQGYSQVWSPNRCVCVCVGGEYLMVMLRKW